MEQRRARGMLAAAAVIFGTLAPFVRGISVSSGELALYRAVMAALLVGGYLLVSGQKLALRANRREAALLLLSGTAMGVNWILLFEAYRYTTVATATLCYYMAPVFVTLASPFLFHEKLTTRKLLCVLAALCGMVFVSGVPQSGLPEAGEATGILLALLSAVLYASDVSINKFLDQVPACERTLVQLAVAALVMIPYILLTEDVAAMTLTPLGAVLLLIVGVFHTGWCYSLFFGSMTYLPAQTVVLFSYIDPIVAIFLSALLLKEPLGWSGILGAVLVLGSTLISELPVRAAAETK